ncbi:2-amino-4-hydroxy-6-hydroxymethyldihydropteridinepyrophosphokinase [Pseudoalteromonas holothuriae]|uniref:2-amino-4-hydroxy-6-hydroxymethyldihydropteridine pyrophosphokinase n=1 Tax=Pseudoalteromonas holothuriae TaxID=2963714 RepID=A0A9W4QWD0_9GAMM|nr:MULTISPECIES: 2-amino-4-hydroxy-6-hydroxymethyldihydropteridine diphosphokinase [unclassified Pseudoalteromonas]CAH9053386.1 2-amino-4-hydroxy-6-hydroxymethyldihydropteridinepyrophosphokinase [Pseudoalteromonas sp. CIP111951]CAH9056141.1 2-amino-4-hydroxy-6-hydroxymethyldihydropteridinepyrophosphokinase [Pseudoalteromonas sp. CIP111854]
MTKVYIGLGANLNAPKEQIEAALLALNAIPHTQLISNSQLYGSKPMGPQDQPDYVNAVACLNTSLEALDLLDALQSIELEQGRQRKDERWGARTLDLDILLFGNEVMQTSRLTVPHYGLCDREFVVYPLLEIAPELILPNGKKLCEIAKEVPLNDLTPLK